MVAEVGFEPTTTFWVVLAYETRELDRATLLRDKGGLVGRIGLAPMKPGRQRFYGPPVLLLTHRPRNWWSHGESRPDLRVANALLYCLSYGPARSVGAAPTRLSFGGSAAQAGALRIEIGSPGWVFTSNETRSKVECV